MNIVREFSRTVTMPLQAGIGRALFKPISVGINITERCNSKCSMCDFWKPGDKKELNFHQMKHILDEIKGFGIDTINISAHGEIFANKDIFPILEYARECDFSIILNTNALSLSDKDTARYVAREIKPFIVSIGLDTLNPSTYEKIRGLSDGLDRVKQGIFNIINYGVSNISIGSVLLDYNVDEILSIIDFAEKTNISSLRFTAYQKFLQETDETWDRITSEENITKITSKIWDLLELRKTHPIIRNSAHYLQNIPAYYRSDTFFPIPCLVGFVRMDIDESGDASLCDYIGKPIGNIFETSLKDLWFSRTANQVRKCMIKGDCPTCWISCYAEESVRFTLKHGIRSNLDGLRRYIRLRKNTHMEKTGNESRI